MRLPKSSLRRVVLLLFSILTFPLGRAAAQTTNILGRVTQAVDERNLVVMKGNVHPLARPEFDHGAAPLDLRMDRMLLVLKRSPEQERALQKLLEDQQDKSSPRYRQWLTPEQFGQHFGPEDSDIQKVTDWLQGHGFQKLRYFRHPYLDVGRDVETRRDAEAFLVARGYRLAPVTMDAWDWAFSRVYDDAKKRADTALQQEVVSAYLSYSAAMFDYEEKLSRDLIGYEPKQILLLHANPLEADHIGELLELLRKRGYRFITLEDALSDLAYGMPDTYVGEEGTGWLEHWAITRGRPPLGAPVFPPAIAQRSKALPPAPGEAPAGGPANP